jgi:hypothetical protein
MRPFKQFGIDINRLLMVVVGIVVVVVIIFLFWWNNSFKIDGDDEESQTANVSSIAGLNCVNYYQRAVAVMLASDPVTRPLSGISSADLVVEMPVTSGGITRLMAIYQCEIPDEIGSVRSARKDFVPLAAGFKSVYAHWGGEHGILVELNKHIIDNLNALTDPGQAFFRKAGVQAPHNGFTSSEKINNAVAKLNYDMVDTFAGYPHSSDKPSRSLSNIADTLVVDYPSPYNVKWVYIEKDNIYSRTRGGRPEIDRNNNQQVSTSVIIKMDVKIGEFYDQYINVDVSGEGVARVYQNGIVINGKWKKDNIPMDSKLFFYDESGDEIKFVPGKIWIEVIAN